MCTTWEKQLVMYIGSAIGIDFLLTMNIGYRKMEKFDIGTPLQVIDYSLIVIYCIYVPI